MADDERLDVDPSTRLTALTNRTAVLAISGDLGGAVALAGRVATLCAQGTARHPLAALRRMHWLECELGRRDLACRAAGAARPAEPAADRPPRHRGHPAARGRAAAQRRSAGPHRRPRRLPMTRDCSCWHDPAATRRRSCRCSAQRQRPHATAGAMGLWLDLQLARLAALRDAGRSAEAAQTALALWAPARSGDSWAWVCSTARRPRSSGRCPTATPRWPARYACGSPPGATRPHPLPPEPWRETTWRARPRCSESRRQPADRDWLAENFFARAGSSGTQSGMNLKVLHIATSVLVGGAKSVQ